MSTEEFSSTEVSTGEKVEVTPMIVSLMFYTVLLEILKQWIFEAKYYLPSYIYY